VHQKGGSTKSEIVSKSMQEALAAWLRKKANIKNQKSLGWLLNRKFTGKRIEGKVPARPFLGFTRAMKKIIPQVVADMLGAQRGKNR
jgi:phage gpG-like protein